MNNITAKHKISRSVVRQDCEEDKGIRDKWIQVRKTLRGISQGRSGENEDADKQDRVKKL